MTPYLLYTTCVRNYRKDAMTAPTTELTFQLPEGGRVCVPVTLLLNAGYAGHDQDAVAAHIAELAELGVPAPSTTPTLYPVAPYLAQQTGEVPAQHARTSGEAEWAMIITGDSPEDVLITAACDHTDRALEVHGVAWSKNAAPDVIADHAWRLPDIRDHLDRIRLVATTGPASVIIQDSSMDELLPPDYWLEVLQARGERRRGTVLLSGTVPMINADDQFADRWNVSMIDDTLGRRIDLGYSIGLLPDPIG